MITEEEKRDIIEQAKQEFMLIIPEVIGNLIANHAAYMKSNAEFYAKYPEFKDHRDAVVSILEKVDGEDTLIPYAEKLEKAVPLIRERIATMKRLNVTSVNNAPSRDFSNTEISNNGVL